MAGSHSWRSEITGGASWQIGTMAHSCRMHRLVHPSPVDFWPQKAAGGNTLRRIARGNPALRYRQCRAVHRQVQPHNDERAVRFYSRAVDGWAAADDYENPWFCGRGTTPDQVSHRRHRAASHRTGTNGNRRHVQTTRRGMVMRWGLLRRALSHSSLVTVEANTRLNRARLINLHTPS